MPISIDDSPVSISDGSAFAIRIGNRGTFGQATGFNPDNDRNGLWVETSQPDGESGGIFLNGNTMALWSPGDGDLFRVLDEDNINGTPVFTITSSVNGHRILHRGSQIHADYVFEPDYQLESIEEHTAFMMKEKHLSAVPKAQIDEGTGQDIVEYGSLMRGLLEELEKAHLYIARVSDVVKDQQRAISKLSAQLQAQSAS
jgi:hypothetical protein